MPLVIPGHSTSVRLHELFATGKLYWVLTAVYAMLMALFIRLFNLTIAMQHEVYVFMEDGMPHKLHISVDDVTSSTITAQG